MSHISMTNLCDCSAAKGNSANSVHSKAPSLWILKVRISVLLPPLRPPLPSVSPTVIGQPSYVPKLVCLKGNWMVIPLKKRFTCDSNWNEVDQNCLNLQHEVRGIACHHMSSSRVYFVYCDTRELCRRHRDRSNDLSLLIPRMNPM